MQLHGWIALVRNWPFNVRTGVSRWQLFKVTPLAMRSSTSRSASNTMAEQKFTPTSLMDGLELESFDSCRHQGGLSTKNEPCKFNLWTHRKYGPANKPKKDFVSWRPNHGQGVCAFVDC